MSAIETYCRGRCRVENRTLSDLCEKLGLAQATNVVEQSMAQSAGRCHMDLTSDSPLLASTCSSVHAARFCSRFPHIAVVFDGVETKWVPRAYFYRRSAL